ncbi:hypothetical protein R3P38DRAFT_2777277 [Favolaschia claudopus]|uniref:Uncharacterized protein n=1 Tax=Favolaschia claudopus TaxID=2862362 RepID=A0AAW0BMM7_9AGAR
MQFKPCIEAWSELFGADDGDGLDLGPNRVSPPNNPNADDGPAASPREKDDNDGNSDAEQEEEEDDEDADDDDEEEGGEPSPAANADDSFKLETGGQTPIKSISKR